jgi:hypothetical protein
MNANAPVLWVLSEILPEVAQRFEKSLKGSLNDELDSPAIQLANLAPTDVIAVSRAFWHRR